MQENKVFKAKTPARYFTSGCFYIKKTEPMLGFKFAQRGVPLSSCVNFLTEISPGPALAVFAFAFGKTHTSLRASSPSRGQSSLPASAHCIKKTEPMLGFKFAQRGTRTLKPCGMRPSNARVYQFRHLREKFIFFIYFSKNIIS